MEKKAQLKRNAITRRGFLRDAGVLAAASVFMTPRVVCDTPKKSGRPSSFGKAKSVIQIWFWGGISQIDTLDPKPNAGYDYCGNLNKTVKTNVDGLELGQLLPELAKCADKYAVLRGLTHGQNAHETGAYLVQTGRMPGRYVYPCAGAVVSKFKGYDAGYKGMIPPYIVLTQPMGRFSEAGFLGTRYKPFATGADPSRTPFEVEGIVARGISRQRQEMRRKFLDDIATFKKAHANSEYLDKSKESVEQAYDLILGDAGKVFDISTENPKLCDAYGRNWFGNSCLIARKLVEAGVPYVTINYNGWDTHKNHFQQMQRMLPITDKAVSSLINDLSQRGLLDSTIVWWSSEFGRTPRIQWDPPYSGGRHHHGDAFSGLLAGGGFKGGIVVGETDSKSMYVVKRPTSPSDVIGSIYANLGIPTDAMLTTPQGEQVRLIPESEAGIKSDGLLYEIM